jgi:hypothetical protein
MKNTGKFGLYPYYFLFSHVQIQECGSVGLYPHGGVDQLMRYFLAGKNFLFNWGSFSSGFFFGRFFLACRNRICGVVL